MESKYELIEKYLADEMSVEEQVEFENTLRIDPDLMHEYILRCSIDNAIKEDDVINLRAKMESISNDKPAKVYHYKKSFLYTSFAAVIILFVISIKLNLLPIKTQDSSSIFESYYTPYPTIMSFRSSSDQTETENLLYMAFSSYEEENYDLAFEYFNKVLIVDNLNYMSQFYLSICEIERSNFQNAEEQLQILIVKKNHVFMEQANWYLALIYMKQDEKTEAEKILRKIVRENMNRKSDAEEILKHFY